MLVGKTLWLIWLSDGFSLLWKLLAPSSHSDAVGGGQKPIETSDGLFSSAAKTQAVRWPALSCDFKYAICLPTFKGSGSEFTEPVGNVSVKHF